ncbi:anti-sigma factor domain-containing protein [Virgibacillus siamensis]|uniref:anti-sigma factor domain-containing protein n=1 Tax=Virgibacillus siamensis TaxID=480071 RepID=UPI0009854C08|nr:anti-sigma factor domain-containing protein [Virgibacillus siamensis]
MKKGIVMEKHRRYMIVMQSDGVFQKAPPMDKVAVGSEVTFEPLRARKRSYFYANNRNFSLKPVAMLCVLLLLLVPVYFMMGVNKTYAYVSIDINPSIELEINDELQVRSMNAVNDDGKEIIKQLADYKGKKLEEVITLIMQKSENNGLIKNGKNMLIGVSYALDKHDISVLDTVDKFFLKNGKGWKIATFVVPKEIHNLADEKEQSMGKVMVSKLNDPAYTGNKSTWMNDGEKAIINSFYNKKKDQAENVDTQENAKKKPESNESDDGSDTSELKETKADDDARHSDIENNKKQKAEWKNQKEAKGHQKGNPGKAKGHHKENRGKAHQKLLEKDNPGKAKGLHKDNPGKVKGHYKDNPGKAKGHHKDNPGKAKGHSKKKHPGKAKGHQKENPGQAKRYNIHLLRDISNRTQETLSNITDSILGKGFILHH